MKILVAVKDYPNLNGDRSLMYVHTRDIYYKAHGIDVTVLSFKTDNDYTIDGIPVISLSSFKKDKNGYQFLVLHAANIRNHFIFLLRYGKYFKKYIFFYHGHEVLKCNEVYSKPYSYVRNSVLRDRFQDIYDDFKLKLWNLYLPKVCEKSSFVFVSGWMKDEFLKWTKLPEAMLRGRSYITYNCIGKEFEINQYSESSLKKYDFITIRSCLDGSKYAIDIVNRLAKQTPDKKFLIIGQGEYFKHDPKAPNLIWEDRTLGHQEIIEKLQESRFALMPTRTDAQGVMMCEMAAFGIPLITSDIPVCHEIFDTFQNVYYINNDDRNVNLSAFSLKLSKSLKHTKFYENNTVMKEVLLIQSLLGRG